MEKKIVFLVISVVMFGFLSLILMSLMVGGSFGLDKLTKDVDNVVHMQELPVFFKVTDERIVGINIDTDGLKLGTIMQGNFAKRDITIINPFQFLINVEISFSENIEDIIEISQDSFSLEVDDSMRLSVFVMPDENTGIGEYEGILTVIMTKI